MLSPLTPTVDLVDALADKEEERLGGDFERGARSRAALAGTPSRTAARRSQPPGAMPPGEISAAEIAEKVRLSVRTLHTYLGTREDARSRARRER